MAKFNYLISGLPGTGKTSVCKELRQRGVCAIDADEAFASQTKDGWIWQGEKLNAVLNDPTPDTLFVCGSASNRDQFIQQFAKVFILYANTDTLRHRLLTRKNNNFGKDPAVLARQLERNKGVKEYSIKRGRLIIDANQPITAVVDEILASIARTA